MSHNVRPSKNLSPGWPIVLTRTNLHRAPISHNSPCHEVDRDPLAALFADPAAPSLFVAEGALTRTIR